MRWLLGAALVACSETELSQLGKQNGGNGSAIEVSPLSLGFGVVGSDDDPVVRTFTVTSVGYATLTVESIELIGEDAASFTFLTEPESFDLEPEESADIQVVFEPAGSGEQFSQAMVNSSDVVDPSVPVNLIGDGAVPDLEINPDPLSMGATYVGCSTTNEVTLTNVGTEDLDIINVTHSGTPFSVDNLPVFPATLIPGQEMVLDLTFAPEVEGQFSGELTVVSNDPEGTQVATQTGVGQYIAMYEQYWDNPVNPPSDIIFSVDLSCSMDDDAANLANNFSSFIGQLSSYSTDWQVIVANSDDGCNNTGILTPSTPNYQSSFAYGVQNGAGSYTEALLTVADNAVQNTDNGECNAGFLRPNAMLHIILVSDEREQSWNNYAYYVNNIIAKKGNPNNVRISAIAGNMSNPGCAWESGTGYYEASVDTNGVFLDICSNWASPTNLQILAEASVIADQYALDQPAVESTVVVYVDGTEIPAGTDWYYDSSLNSVIFTSNPPEEGSNVRITYASPAACE